MKKTLITLLAVGFIALLSACSDSGRDGGRVLVLGMDGMDPETVDLLMSEGKMPNFARLRQEGAYGRLKSFRPLLSPIIWTTIATGKSPIHHGIGDFVTENDSAERKPVTSGMRQVKALWNIASENDRTVGVVGWWATWPPESVNGYIVSDHTAYHFLFEDGFSGGQSDETKTWPSELLQEITPTIRRPSDLTYAEVQRFVNVSEEDFTRDFDFEDDLSHFKWALATTDSYSRLGLELWDSKRPDLGMVYIEGTDSTAHLFGHLFRNQDLGGELSKQSDQFGKTVEEIYLYADEILGRYMEALDEDTTLVLLSDHGFKLGELHDDPTRTRDMRRVSERFHREKGILYLWGRGVKEHGRLNDPTIFDIAPTVLTLLGLPVADDFQGRVLAEAFDSPPTPQRVASFEGDGDPVRIDSQDATVDEAMLKRLESLGYIDSTTPRSSKATRNLAAIAYEAGQYREAAKMYQQLIQEDPDDPAMLASLAGVLGAMERYDEARVQLEKAVALSPLNPETHHNLGVLAERENSPDQAIEHYRTALRYSPGYEPSQQSLYRLTGQTSIYTPENEGEKTAFALAEMASQSARRGNYDEALAFLDQAEQAAPQLSLIYQYKANIAYLKGDKALARRALKRGLEIEPDNALFQENLNRLEEELQ